jgi:hypothetical protein
MAPRLAHIQKFLLDWNVPTRTGQASCSASIPRSYSQVDDWELLTKPKSPQNYEDAYTFSSKEIETSEQLPLSSVPNDSSNSNTSHYSKSDEPGQGRKLERFRLDRLPEGPSLLEMYQLDVQNHERRAVGLEVPLVRRDIKMRKREKNSERDKDRDNGREKKKRKEA